MTTTPEQIEAVARAMCDTEWGEGYWDEVMPYARREYKRQAASAINTMRPFIREAALEEAARETEENAAVLDHPSVYMGGASGMAKRKAGFLAAAIRALKEKP